MLFREATKKDLIQLAEIRWDFKFENHHLDTDISKDSFIRHCYLFLQEGLANGEWIYWIAEDNNLIVSQVFIRKIRKVPKPQRFLDEYGYVTNVYTRPAYRNKSVGGQLMKKVKEWAFNNDLEILIVWPSSQSVKFYERAGFISQNDVMELIIRDEY